MAIANYTELRQAIADWLNRADLDEKIPDFISLAEATLNSVLRSSYMVNSASVSTAASTRTASVPSDFLEPIYIQSSDTNPLEQVSPQQLIMLRRSRLRTAGTPRFFAILGRNFEFVPTPSSVSSLSLVYYQKIPALSTGSPTNWLLENFPDLYLYTSLLHATPYLNDDARLAVFNNLIAQTVSAAVQKNQIIQFDDKSAGFSLRSLADAGAAPPMGSAIGPGGAA
jgi:hypothetical protein